MEGMNNLGYKTCIYGNVTMKPPYNYHILTKMFQNNEGQEGQTGPEWGWVPMKVWRA
jgi:hypothetical protein